MGLGSKLAVGYQCFTVSRSSAEKLRSRRCYAMSAQTKLEGGINQEEKIGQKIWSRFQNLLSL